MFGLPKLVNYTILGVATLGIVAGIFFLIDTEDFAPPPTVAEQVAECALSKMTVKMKRDKALAEHQYIIGTINNTKVTYINPINDRTFMALVKSCAPMDATQKDRIDATNRLAVILAYDDEFQRLKAPHKRQQDRALMRRK